MSELARAALTLHDAAGGAAVLRDGPRRRVTAACRPQKGVGFSTGASLPKASGAPAFNWVRQA